MNRFFPFVFLFSMRAAFAWGVLGHQLVASMAEDMLTPKARAEAFALLGPNGGPGSLARIATWSDDIRILRPETRPWHYVTIQIGEPRYDAAKADTPNVVGALNNALRVLRKPDAAGADRYAREEALKWVVHLVGDLHQPLHVGEDHDKGGNLLKVKVGRRTHNLHEVWDFVLLERLHLSLDTLRGTLESELAADPGFLRSNARGTVEDWVNETHLRSAACYEVRGKSIRKGIKMSLERDYLRGNTVVALGQIKRAAVRLAFLLNGALDPTHAAPVAPAGGVRIDYFARSEDVPEETTQPPQSRQQGSKQTRKQASYAWSVHSKIYHLAGCADLAKIKPKNLRTGDIPPPFLELHKGCPAR
jgi:hypothetical protein